MFLIIENNRHYQQHKEHRLTEVQEQPQQQQQSIVTVANLIEFLNTEESSTSILNSTV
jgi:hypothetical protein